MQVYKIYGSEGYYSDDYCQIQNKIVFNPYIYMVRVRAFWTTCGYKFAVPAWVRSARVLQTPARDQQKYVTELFNNVRRITTISVGHQQKGALLKPCCPGNIISVYYNQKQPFFFITSKLPIHPNSKPKPNF